jgi:hypothetical protein
MDIYVGIDGSGPGDNAEYRKEFEKSFVQGYYKSGLFQRAYYVRGPGMLGGETPALARGGLKWVQAKLAEAKNTNQKYRIFLSGYSRGGAAVTEIAYQLKQDAIRVHAMLLFDAVDRSELPNSHVDVVPSNVAKCYHARRDPKAGSREMFGNCATTAEVPGNLATKFFMCTHGAMGGTPWKKAGASGRIEELTTQEKSAIVAAGSMGGVRGAMAAKREADRQDFTNVTLDMEQRAGEKIKKWMDDNLAAARQAAVA